MSQETRVVDFDQFKTKLENIASSFYIYKTFNTGCWSPDQLNDLNNIFSSIESHIQLMLFNINREMENSLYSVERCLICSKKYNDKYNIPDALKPE